MSQVYEYEAAHATLPVGELDLAHTDTLTHLPNRLWLDENLSHYADRYPGGFALAFADVDGLKSLNDTEGHEAGDELIRITADLLSEGLRTDDDPDHPHRPKDIVSFAAARLGGDEFVLLLPGISTQKDVDVVTKRMQDKLHQAGISISIGGRPHKPGENGTQLLADVDSLMYAQKQQRRQAQFEALPRRKRAAAHLGKRLLGYAGVKPPR